MDHETAEDIKWHFDVVAEGLRGEIGGFRSDVGELRSEVGDLEVMIRLSFDELERRIH